MPSPGVPTSTSERTQRVHWFAGRLTEVLDDLVGVDGDTPLALSVLSVKETVETVTELDQAIARLTGMRAAVLAHADELKVGLSVTPVATSTPAWFRSETTTAASVSTRTVKDAIALQERCTATGAALRAGRVDGAQAHEIIRALDKLPADLDPALRAEAETHLLHLATTHPADELRKLGTHLHEVIDPDAAEALLAQQLAKDEDEAHDDATLWMHTDTTGTRFGGFIPAFHGAHLAAILDRYANPTRPDTTPSDAEDEKSSVPPVFESRDRAWGRAFLELLESIPTGILPSQGGTTIATVVTIPLDTLLGGLGPAVLENGLQLSPGEARRLAARHGVIPAVLGGPSKVLDLGRKQRLFTASQRLALRIQHPTCTAQGCRIPAAWCQAHHKLGWHPQPGQRPGRTDLANGTLLCGRHHRLVDKPGYHTTYHPDGTTVITRIRRWTGGDRPNADADVRAS